MVTIYLNGTWKEENFAQKQPECCQGTMTAKKIHLLCMSAVVCFADINDILYVNKL